MAGTVKHARLESASARNRLKRGRQPHWQALIEGKVHLGYQCWKGEPAGRWVLRRYIGKHKTGNDKDGKDKLIAKYRISTLGLADDAAKADGIDVLSYEQAEAKARAMVEAPSGSGKIERITVRQALDLYIEHKRNRGQPVGDVLSRGMAHIVPPLGDLVAAELTAKQLNKWLATMAAQPAQSRPKAGKPKFRSTPDSEEGIRARRASANRALTMLKAALNHAYDEGHVANRDAWGRKLKPFREVDVARVRYLTVAQAERLLNACDTEFRPLVRAALETGCRYSELTRIVVHDYNPDANTVTIGKSKSGKARHVILTPEGAEFFREHCAGRDGTEPIFRGADGSTWNKSDQARPMHAACARARITPSVSFHALRHTWASLAAMNGVPLMVVAKNLGHADTRMVEKHYGHLAPSYIADAIRAGAPRFTVTSTSNVEPLRSSKPSRTLRIRTPQRSSARPSKIGAPDER
ncbi:MAG: site-specific integrase [Xanthobacteraceae bacterium]